MPTGSPFRVNLVGRAVEGNPRELKRQVYAMSEKVTQVEPI